ncbi:hypothetical protein FF38_01024 [Lucilia cuprina]|uniref:Uncharacterized protein n=1 Tax=Lucilia cuprina TaxID=7375 RepID=A0A0L0CH96_LUCCU|nr:hypothetical protein FF38_01024 [Lucilia cuprina]
MIIVAVAKTRKRKKRSSISSGRLMISSDFSQLRAGSNTKYITSDEWSDILRVVNYHVNQSIAAGVPQNTILLDIPMTLLALTVAIGGYTSTD